MSTVNFKFENGDQLKDKVSGFVGIVMVRAEYSTGCIHYGLASEAKDGNIPEWNWLDQSRVELSKKNVVTFEIPEGTTSGPFPSGPEC